MHYLNVQHFFACVASLGLFWLGHVQARRQRGGNAPPIFVFAHPIFFLPRHGIFLGGRSWCFWAEKTLKFVISARKSLRISAKTFAP